jgi:hypothetical protein
MIRYIDKTLVFFGLLAVLWLCIPSSLFIRHIDTRVDGNTVIFVRDLPFGTVPARWRSEITMLDGRECSSGAWRTSTYQEQANGIVSYELDEWAASCVSEGPPFVLRTHRQVLLFGLIPLRPSNTVTQVQGLN